MSEDTELEEVTTEGEEEATTEGAKISEKTLEFQKRKALKERDDARAENLRLQGELSKLGSEKPKQEATEKSADKVGVLEMKLTQVEFVQNHPEFSKEASKEILDYSSKLGINPEEALSSPVLQAYIEKAEEKARIEMASPTSNRSAKFKSEKPVSEMSNKEHEEWARKMLG